MHLLPQACPRVIHFARSNRVMTRGNGRLDPVPHVLFSFNVYTGSHFTDDDSCGISQQTGTPKVFRGKFQVAF